MADDLKNLKEVAHIVDDAAGVIFDGLGCLTMLFLLVLPLAVAVVFLTMMLCNADPSYSACKAILPPQ